MGASISEFLANFQGGGLRPNRYRVVMTFPSAIAGLGGSDASRKISYTCSAAAIPATNMGVIDVPYYGRQLKVPGDKVWDDWNVTIHLDNDMLGRNIFEDWHNAINGFQSNITANPALVNPSNVYANASVELLDRADQVLTVYEVTSMFPTLVSEITLGYDANDQIALQTVTFAINGWRTRDI